MSAAAASSLPSTFRKLQVPTTTPLPPPTLSRSCHTTSPSLIALLRATPLLLSSSSPSHQVHKLSPNFREATHIVESKLSLPPKPGFVVVKVYFAGVNASDINFSAGRYSRDARPPYDVGAESVGRVVAVGADVKRFKVGDAVATVGFAGAYGEYQTLRDSNRIYHIATVTPNVLPLLVSGLTAMLALEEVGQMRTGETVLVTAAAGGTGQLAVRLAKLAGNHVIGTCSSPTKAAFLKELGCDRVIVYTKENIDKVLRKEYPNGIDLVYESVGGETFLQCVRNLAIFGRLVVIGAVSGYADSTAFNKNAAAEKLSKSGGGGGVGFEIELLRRSASVRGFFMDHFADKWSRSFERLHKLYAEGKLGTVVEIGGKWHSSNSAVRGGGGGGGGGGATSDPAGGVADAVEYLYTGKSKGKVVVQIATDEEVAAAAAAAAAGKGAAANAASPKAKL